MSLLVVLFVTVGLGGAAAFVSGRAIAATWRPLWMVPIYMALLAAAVRFIHFSVFGGTLLSIVGYLIDYATVLAFGVIGYRLMRRDQMDVQYGWSTRGETET